MEFAKDNSSVAESDEVTLAPSNYTEQGHEPDDRRPEEWWNIDGYRTLN
jgi:hypothetical protein